MAIRSEGKGKDQIICRHDHLVQQTCPPRRAARPKAHPDPFADHPQPPPPPQSKVARTTSGISSDQEIRAPK